MRLATAFIAALCLTSAAAEAQTTAYFSYVDAADHIDLTGQLMGSLSGNYFTIGSVSDLTFNGQPVAFTPAYDGSADTIWGDGPGHNGNGTAVVSLDGTYMDWATASANRQDGFQFADGDMFAQYQFISFESGSSFGDKGVRYHPADWTLNFSVPEPAGLAVFGAGLAALGFIRRRPVASGCRA
jgi:hypothetical protein